ncbi:MAG: O-antigen translocase [Marinilabiliales bacterium]
MKSEQTSYRQIIKATSLFGGVQVFRIIIMIIRSKFIAVLLGPLGMGISGLLTSTTSFIGALTNFGLGTSAVRDIAAAYGSGDKERVSIVVTVLRRLIWITGLLGMLITIVLAPWLSQITFGNKDYTLAFILISITLLLKQISSGQSVLLQGMRQIKLMAKSGMIGSLLGLFTTVPLYYFYGIDGIVPAIIITSVTTLLLTWYFANKLKVKAVQVTKAQTIAEGKGMLQMGFMISLSGLITLGASYIVRIFISNTGGIEEVGLYNAGFAFINTYVGLVFTAMGTDYYPRLSAVAHDNIKCKEIINQQAEVALLILGPIIAGFIIFIHWVIILLYSNKFIAIDEMINYAALGTLFKAASWSIAFVFLAKGNSKLFFGNEFITNIYLLGFNILGYHLGGLTGLGISFLAAYIVYLIQVFFVSKFMFQFNFDSAFIKIFFFQLVCSVAAFILIKFVGGTLAYLFGSLVIIISAVFSFYELDKRIGLKVILQNLIQGLR